MRKINFRKQVNKSYLQVQDNINQSICRHLLDDEHSNTKCFKPGCLNISYFIRHEADVLMSHGVADKNYLSMRNSGERMVNKFQHILVPGPWLKNKILNLQGCELNADQIHVVGWPRLDSLYRERTFYLERQKQSSPVRVLWAPTHDRRKRGIEKESTSSFPEFALYEKDMKSKYDYSVSVHPRNRDLKAPTSSSLVESDYVISDFGTMVYEAWALGIPVIFPRWILKDKITTYIKGSAEAFIFENNIGLHANSIEEVHMFIEQGYGIGDEVKQFMEDYLPEKYLGCSGEAIANLLRTLSVKHSFRQYFSYYSYQFKKRILSCWSSKGE